MLGDPRLFEEKVTQLRFPDALQPKVIVSTVCSLQRGTVARHDLKVEKEGKKKATWSPASLGLLLLVPGKAAWHTGHRVKSYAMSA